MNVPNYLPKKIIRRTDGAEFLLDEKTNEYHLWLPYLEETDHFSFGYSYEKLMSDPETFKVATGSLDEILPALTQRLVALENAVQRLLKKPRL